MKAIKKSDEILVQTTLRERGMAVFALIAAAGWFAMVLWGNLTGQNFSILWHYAFVVVVLIIVGFRDLPKKYFLFRRGSRSCKAFFIYFGLWKRTKDVEFDHITCEKSIRSDCFTITLKLLRVEDETASGISRLGLKPISLQHLGYIAEVESATALAREIGRLTGANVVAANGDLFRSAGQ